MKDKNVLLVWIDDVNGCKFFVLKAPDEKVLKVLEKANGTFVNSYDQNPDTLRVMYATADREYEESWLEGAKEDKDVLDATYWLFKFDKFKKESPVKKQNINEVYHCGFIN